MPVLSYLYQLFNVDQCQAYIHTLRWKDRPLQCPRCQSLNVGPWGAYHYQPGLQRYRCTLIGSRALVVYGDVDGPSAANNRPWLRK
jgi:hypothetical protein